jgi:hypothetical protein
MESIPKEIIERIESLPEDKKHKIVKFITRETEVGRIPSLNELETIINYLENSEKSKKTYKLPESFPNEILVEKNCLTCKFNKDNLCQNKESELFDSKIFPSMVCNKFEIKNG